MDLKWPHSRVCADAHSFSQIVVFPFITLVHIGPKTDYRKRVREKY